MIYILNRGPLAQLEEQLTLNQLVTGSSPVRLTSNREKRQRVWEAEDSESSAFFTNISVP